MAASIADQIKTNWLLLGGSEDVVQDIIETEPYHRDKELFEINDKKYSYNDVLMLDTSIPTVSEDFDMKDLIKRKLNFRWVTDGIADMFGFVSGMISDILNDIVTPITDLLDNLISSIIGSNFELFSSITNLVKAFSELITELIPQLVNVFAEIGRYGVDNFVAFTNYIIEKVGEIDSFWDVLFFFLRVIWDAFEKALTWLLKGIFSGLGEKIKNLWSPEIILFIAIPVILKFALSMFVSSLTNRSSLLTRIDNAKEMVNVNALMKL